MREPGRVSASGAVEVDDWDDAPCGLVLLDDHDRVRAANSRFLDLCGRAFEDVVAKAFWNELLTAGSQMFYLTQLAPVLELDGALNEVMVELRTADGGRVPALLNARRVSDKDGRRVATRIALMGVADRRLYETQLRQARQEAEQARADADQARSVESGARHRLEFLGRANAVLASGGDVAPMLDRLTSVLVADVADWCVIYVPDPDDADVVRWSAAHADPGRRPLLEWLAESLPAHTGAQSALRRVRDGEQPMLLTHVGEEHLREAIDNAEVLAAVVDLGVGSAIVAPCVARRVNIATVVVIRRPGRPPFTNDDLMDLADLAARTGIVIDNLRRSAREHSNSVALQQALLTAPPSAPRLEIVTRYLPATAGNEIGGDWYDAFLQPDGTPVLAIGDVVGHDIHAAAAMGHLRGVIRTVGYTTGGTPADILSRSDVAARGLGVDVLASVLIARVECGSADAATLRWSNAGHPPPILLAADGPRLLDAAPDRPLGLGPKLDRPRHDHTVQLEVGDVLLLYTDGLIERVDEDLDAGLDRLRNVLRQAREADLGELCDLVLAGDRIGVRDDIALLAVRLVDGEQLRVAAQ